MIERIDVGSFNLGVTDALVKAEAIVDAKVAEIDKLYEGTLMSPIGYAIERLAEVRDAIRSLKEGEAAPPESGGNGGMSGADNDNRPYSSEELATRWGVSAQHVRDLIAKGDLRHFRVGRLIRIPATAVREFEECQPTRIKLYRGKYYAVWTGEDAQTNRQSLRTADREEAERRIVDFRRDKAAPAGSTVGEYVAAYLAYKDGRVRDHVRLAGAWKMARDTFGALRPDQITPELCEEYIGSRRAMGRSDGTILKELNVIRQALNWNKVNTARFEAPSAPPPRDRHLSKEEARRLVDGAFQPHVKLYILLALLTAARRGALLDLTWDRVDLERAIIKLTIEDEERRKKRATVPINDQLKRELEAAKEAKQTAYVIEYAGGRVLNIKKGFAKGCGTGRAGGRDTARFAPHRSGMDGRERYSHGGNRAIPRP